MDWVVREVRRFMWSRGTGGAGVVAVSGGADSVALLHALVESGCGPLTIAHVNHQLRGADSDADEAFVRSLGVILGVTCRTTSVNMTEIAAGENLEAAARRVRYEFFTQCAAEAGAAWIATGHTADDQAETVLHRMIRGTGLQGLRGIASGRSGSASPPVFPTGGLSPSARPDIVRPLLAVTRAGILAYLASRNQPFREDASNIDPRFTRNRIRHELLPLLKSFNPDIVAALANLAVHASEAHEIITARAAEVLAQAERPRAGNTVILDVAALGDSPALIRAVLRRVWDREEWPVSEMGFDAWDRAVEVARGAATACDFPGGITMRHAGRVIQLQSSRFQVPGPVRNL